MAITALVAMTLSGCGTDPKAAVRAKVQQFATASAEHDYTTICTQVLSPALTAHLRATGVSCEQAWALALGSVRSPTLSVGQTTVKGSTATVIVLTVAQGQRSSLDTIGLTKTGDGWRIQSLTSALPTGSG
jgi:ketosteroid isomerase-like protein